MNADDVAQAASERGKHTKKIIKTIVKNFVKRTKCARVVAANEQRFPLQTVSELGQNHRQVSGGKRNRQTKAQ
jgi:prolyl-tRNA editing enzyme YbaK/EbsC (Cys-tRNA(Pro) deacylase)